MTAAAYAENNAANHSELHDEIDNPIGTANKPLATRYDNRGNRSNRRSPYSQAVYLQDLCLAVAEKSLKAPLSLAALARAWDVLEERKRILRGVPLPGQYRPDELPNKRIKGRMTPQKFIELAKANAGAFTAEDEPDTDAAPASPPSPPKKELDTPPKSTP